MTNVTSTKVLSGRATLAVEDSGANSGTTLVFLHAGVADQRSWGALREELLRAEPSLRVLTYDRRGFGRSSWSAEPHSRVGDLMAVIDSVAADSVGADSVVLVGNSQGGRVAIDAALAHPGRVSALVLMATAVSGAPASERFPDDVQRLSDAIDAAEGAQDLALVNELEAQLWLDGPSSPAGRVSGAARDLFLDMNGIALRAEGPGDCTDDELASWASLGQLSMPTLVIVGDLDLPHLRERARTLVATMPNARLVEVSGVAHMLAMEKPADIAALIAGFVADPMADVMAGS